MDKKESISIEEKHHNDKTEGHKLYENSSPVDAPITDCQRQQLASGKQPFVCEALRHKLVQEAALVGRERISKKKQIARLEKEKMWQQELKEAHLVRVEQAKDKERLLALEAQTLFKQLRKKVSQTEKQEIHEKKVLSQQKMIEFEDKRVNILWKILLTCEKSYLNPSECRELSRLYLHLKRATTV